MMHTDREKPCAAVSVPASMCSSLIGYEWARDAVGEAGAAVYRLHSKAGAPDLFLKHAQSSIVGDLTDEMVRLRWLASHIPVPAVEAFVLNQDEAWLLMTAVPGQTAYQLLEANPDGRIEVIDALVSFLGRLHAIPISACPFTSDHVYRLAQARERIDAGLIDEDDFDDEREGWTSEQVWEAMQGLLPIPSDPVVTHGDFSLDNILMLDGEVVGCIDTGKAGIADRYQDLAILWNNLGGFGASLQDRLLEQYGIAHADERKLRFHLLLDEMF